MVYKSQIKLTGQHSAHTHTHTHTHTHHRSKTCCQTQTTHIISTTEPLYVISIKYSLSLPDDGSYVMRNIFGVYFNVCLLDFYIT